MKYLLTTLFVIFLSACAANMPAPAVSEYLKTEGGGFLLEKDSGLKYAMNYALIKPVEANTSYKVVFENTIPNGLPIVAEGKIEPEQSKLIIQSPVISGVKNHQTYSVTLSLLSGEKVFAIHKDQVRFSVPSSMLAQFGVTEH